MSWVMVVQLVACGVIGLVAYAVGFARGYGRIADETVAEIVREVEKRLRAERARAKIDTEGSN